MNRARGIDQRRLAISVLLSALFWAILMPLLAFVKLAEPQLPQTMNPVYIELAAPERPEAEELNDLIPAAPPETFPETAPEAVTETPPPEAEAPQERESDVQSEPPVEPPVITPPEPIIPETPDVADIGDMDSPGVLGAPPSVVTEPLVKAQTTPPAPVLKPGPIVPAPAKPIRVPTTTPLLPSPQKTLAEKMAEAAAAAAALAAADRGAEAANKPDSVPDLAATSDEASPFTPNPKSAEVPGETDRRAPTEAAADNQSAPSGELDADQFESPAIPSAAQAKAPPKPNSYQGSSSGLGALSEDELKTKPLPGATDPGKGAPAVTAARRAPVGNQASGPSDGFSRKVEDLKGESESTDSLADGSPRSSNENDRSVPSGIPSGPGTGDIQGSFSFSGGATRALLSPRRIEIPDKYLAGQPAELTSEVSFTVDSGGHVLITSIQFKPRWPTNQLVEFLRNFFAAWVFTPSSSDGQVVFRYSIKVK